MAAKVLIPIKNHLLFQFRIPQYIVYELLGCPAGEASVGQFPFVGLQEQLLRRPPDSVSVRQSLYDALELLLVGGTEINGDAEAIYQGQLLLHSIAGVHVLPDVRKMAVLVFVAVVLTDEMTAVGCGVNQHILRLLLQPALNDGLEIFIFNLKFFK